MPVINVFVSYADSFVGKRVLHQFQQFPSVYRVYGCTWDSAAAEELNALATDAGRPNSSQPQPPHDPTGASALSDEGDSSMPPHSRGTLTPCESSHADTATPLPGAEGDGGVATQVAAGAKGMTAAAATVEGRRSAVFFSRHDVAATRAALLACDWIVVELRQAQTVLEVVQFLQQQPSFARPKRLVLLSSLMTWYATPPLSAPDAVVMNGESAADGAGEGDEDEDDDVDATGQEEEEEEADIAAPYPPPALPAMEALLQAAQAAAKHAVVDAMRGVDGTAAAADGSGEDAAGAAAAAGDGGAEGSGEAEEGAEAEVLTEDQYNRRVPHLRYMSWRDAEKAVASAHHAKGLPLDTFVICSGLPYGGEEDALEPLFRMAWSAQPEKTTPTATPAAAAVAVSDGAAQAVLPIFGSGRQRVPLVHAQDLACFVRKLLRCPAARLPFPERRYLFATDGVNTNSWRAIVAGVNHMFGDRCALQSVPPSSYPLYRDVEKFTMDLRVEAESMKAVMEQQGLEEEEEGAAALAADGGKGGAGNSNNNNSSAAGGGGGAVRLPDTWVAQGGLPQHLRSVADEFTLARGVTPLRLALVGPPLSGKTFLSSRLAQHYHLPCISLDSVVAEYKAALNALQQRMASAKAAVLEAELSRRRDIKRRRVVAKQQREWDAGVVVVEGAAADAHDGDDAATTAAEDDAAADQKAVEEVEGGGSSDDGSGGSHRGSRAAAAAAAAMATHAEVPASALELTPQETEEATRLVQEWWAEQPLVQAWSSKAAEMERVLLLRLHPRPPTPDANPKRRAGGGGGGNGGGGSKKKGNAGKDVQKSKEDEEEVQQLKASLQTAPFQPRALTLMLRWRLAQPDCRVQGFVLDGVPTTLELARMVFSVDGEDSVQPPATEEEALKPRYAGEPSAAAANAADGQDGAGEGGGAAAAAGPTAAKETASDARLPAHVIVLQASDTFLLNRLRAMGEAAEQQAASSAAPSPASPAAEPPRAPDVEAFQQALLTYKREYVEAPYSVLSFFECAVATTAAVASTGAAGQERRAEVHTVTVDTTEPLVPPPPPASPHAPVAVGETERLLRDVVVGAPHNFGQSPEELQREAVRQRCLAEEAARAEEERRAAQAAAESAECGQETRAREEEAAALTAMRRADVAELEARKQPLTRYLQERVLPLLHKGLLEVCATRPEDPVDYLAEWLMRHNPHDDTFCDI